MKIEREEKRGGEDITKIEGERIKYRHNRKKE